MEWETKHFLHEFVFLINNSRSLSIHSIIIHGMLSRASQVSQKVQYNMCLVTLAGLWLHLFTRFNFSPAHELHVFSVESFIVRPRNNEGLKGRLL